MINYDNVEEIINADSNTCFIPTIEFLRNCYLRSLCYYYLMTRETFAHLESCITDTLIKISSKLT